MKGYCLNLDNQMIWDSQICQRILELVKDEAYNYGYRKIAVCLRKKHRIIINKKKVYRLCKDLKILRPPHIRKHQQPRIIAKNRVITRPNQLWQTDIKYGYIQGEERFFYILAYIDVFDRMIVGYDIALNCSADAAVSALKKGLIKRQLFDQQQMPCVRSDNGVQFTSNLFAASCKELGVLHERIPPKTPNMNAYIEAFNGVLEDDCLSLFEFDTFEEAKQTVERYLKYYNTIRIHGSIGYMAPSEYHQLFKDGKITNIEIRL